jgi:NADPH:quinone reductase-like Zn-dependent oxidoreductase
LHMLRTAVGTDDLAGRTVLVVGGAGAVGSAALQLVSALRGRPLAVARRSSHPSVTGRFGAVHAFDPVDGPLGDQVRQVIPGGVDVVLDTTGSGQLAGAALACLARGGVFVTCSALPGEELTISLADLYQARWRVIGCAASDVRDVRTALDMVADGVVEPAIDMILPLARFADGYAEMNRPGRSGKVVFEVAP